MRACTRTKHCCACRLPRSLAPPPAPPLPPRSHTDLKANLHPDVGFNAIAGMDPADPYDDYGHGTHVAGIIAASGNNSLGVTGVVWNKVQVLSCKFMTSGGWGLTSDAIQCVSWCTAKGANVISNSWSGGRYENPPLRDAVAAAGSAGALFVVAAGNEGLDIDVERTYPASYSLDFDHVLTGASPSRAGWLAV